MALLNSPILYFLFGMLFGLYLGNSKIRKSVNDMIDKYAFKKKKQPEEKPKTKDTNTYDD
jgi:hypothetical protein